MTLLVLEIVIPELSHSEVANELPKRLLELLPDIWSYATSFIILGFFWISHDGRFHYIKRANRTLLWITVFYLMFIAFIPFSTALIGQYGDQQISVIIYGINIIIVQTWACLQWKYATKEHRLVDSDLDPKFIVKMSRRLILRINTVSDSDCCFISKYSSKSYIICSDPNILSHTSAILLVSV